MGRDGQRPYQARPIATLEQSPKFGFLGALQQPLAQRTVSDTLQANESLLLELYTYPFAQALASLKRNIALVSSPEAKASSDMAQALTAGAIQAFEYCYELAVKLIRRRLKDMAEAPQSVEELDFRNLMRLAADKGLIDDPAQWERFRVLRNATSHTYHAATAAEVFGGLPVFLETAMRLLVRLDEAIHAS